MPSRMADIESGLHDLRNVIVERGIRSIAIPPLGSGLGKLPWPEVKRKIAEALSPLSNVKIFIYEPSAKLSSQELLPVSPKPAMTSGRAVLVKLMDHYLNGWLDTSITLIEIHKLMYFMQVAGEPLRLRFSKGIYGPYASNLRHVLIRIGARTGEVLVALVVSDENFSSSKDFAAALHQRHPNIKTIVAVRNREKTSMVIPEDAPEKILYGKGYIIDEICGLRFRISAKSFYQVNPVQTEKLYSQALAYAGLTGKETVWDLYCGIGTISLFLAKQAGKVYGVEIVPDAIRDAQENAERNGITNAEFFVGKAEEVLPEKYEKEGIHADVIVVDPPRKGCDERCLETMVKMQPERIVYVSCDSATLARDVKYLRENGYEIVKGRGCDMFPGTVHVETVVLLSKLNAKQHIEVELNLDELDLRSRCFSDTITKHVSEFRVGFSDGLT